MTEPNSKKTLTFRKGPTIYDTSKKGPGGQAALDVVRNDFNEVLSAKNLTFLFGSGCSSLMTKEWAEQGIPTMGPLAKGLLSQANRQTAERFGLTDAIRQTLIDDLGVDLDDKEYSGNLERLMEVLYGFQFALSKTSSAQLRSARQAVDDAISAIKLYVFETCANGQQQPASAQVLALYRTFYQKLSQRSRSLPRPTVATTNYDLFNELAMDRSGVPYINGFLGSIEKRFNPASFRYTIAQRLDASSPRWTSLDNLVYFLKLHGSLNWHAVDNGLFPVEERPLAESGDGRAMLIYPTPAKQNASFAAPYSDLFREFQTRVVQEQSVLVTVGYSFGDEHVNNIIYQALTVPTFRLVILAKPESDDHAANANIHALQQLNDPRIWIIGTSDSKATWKAHYFKEFVEDLMPSGPDDPAESALDSVMDLIRQAREGDANVNE